MKIDSTRLGYDLDLAGPRARSLEERGYHGTFTTETTHDPFLPLAVAATATTTLELATGIVVAFARSPMSLAVTAHNLQVASRGRMRLGLGSQVKAHIEGRYSMPWSHPAHRMREYITAMHRIWAAFNDESGIDFAGDFYSFSLLTPNFRPPPCPSGRPFVALGAVGPRMTEVAGEVADGIILHSLTSPDYIKQVTQPALQAGRQAAGSPHREVEISLPIFVASGRTEGELAAAIHGVKTRIAFYGSTGAYRPVLELHGWGDLQPELHALSVAGKWTEMPHLISDEMVNAFAIVGPIDEVTHRIYERYGNVVDRFSINAPYDHDESLWDVVASDLRQGVIA